MNEEYISLRYEELMTFFEEYLVFGGYPGVVLEEDLNDKKAKLQDLTFSFIKKDIHDSKVEFEEKFFHLMIMLAGQIGNLLNKNTLAKSLGVNNQTIEHYLTVLRKCFHVGLLRPFYTNITNELTKMPKIYFLDPGFRNSLLNRFSKLSERDDKGFLLENYIFNRLREVNQDEAIHFWRTANGQEVDFVIGTSESGGKAFEVKFNALDFRMNKYKPFTSRYPDFPLRGVSMAPSAGCLPVMKV